jgi:hypothetical protein
MASNIVTNTIDETFPIAGRDNSTQGFRDNFGIIKANFAIAKSEIEDLQDNVIRKDTDNNMVGSEIADANLRTTTQVMYNITDANVSTVSASFNNGHYHKYNLTDSSSTYTLSLINWPASINSNRYAKMTVELFSTAGIKTVTWTSVSVTGPASQIKTSSNWPATYTIPLSESNTVYTSVIAEFWTYDGGTTVYANYLGTF